MATATTTKNATAIATAAGAGKPGASEDEVEQCSICCVEPVSNAIVKDRIYDALIKFYFESVDVDVKPAEFRKQSLCTKCFDMLVEFYDTNDILVILGREFNLAKQRLLSTVEKGIESCREHKKPLTPTQQTILEGLPSLVNKVKVKLIKEEPADGFNQAYCFRSYLKPPHSSSKSKNANESSNNESSDSREKLGSSSKPSAGSKRRRDASSEGASASDSQRSPEKAQPSRRLPPRNKTKTPRYNDDSQNSSVDDDASTVEVSTKDNDEDDNQCKVWSETFPNKAHQINHMREKHTSGKTRYPCSTCRKVFEKCNELTEHKKSCPSHRRGK